MDKYYTHIPMLNEALVRAKLYRNITRRDVARKSGVSYNTIGSWLRGETNPTFFMLKSVINACGYRVNYAMEEK